MTLFRYKPNQLLYTIEFQRNGNIHFAIPYKHTVEIGGKQRSRKRQFMRGMTMNNFEAVAET